MSEPKIKEPKIQKEPKPYKYVFVLELADGNWYIGRSNTPLRTVNLYCMNDTDGRQVGSRWTREHYPIEVDLVCRSSDVESRKIVVSYVQKY